MTPNIGIAEPSPPDHRRAWLNAEAIARMQRTLAIPEGQAFAEADVHWNDGQCHAELRSLEIQIGPQRLNLLPQLDQSAIRWVEAQFVEAEKR